MQVKIRIFFVQLTGQVAYDDSTRGEEIDEMIKNLSRPLGRIQLGDGFHGNSSSPALMALKSPRSTF